MEYEEKCAIKTAPLVGTTWYEVVRKEFKLVKFGPLRVCTEEDLPKDSQRYSHLTDGSGNMAWWPDMVNKKANKYSTMFLNRDEAIAYLKSMHLSEIRKFQKYLQFHEDTLSKLV